MSGPTIPVAVWADETKYRQPGESFSQKCGRIAGELADSEHHYNLFKDILKDQRFLPGGRIQSSVGSARETTAFNCFVMKKVPDSLDGIMNVAKEAAKTMQLGGGVGYDFSGIRPKGSRIKSLGSYASGPLSFMEIFDSLCKTIASAGHRRGAQMACMRVDHPDIMDFITAKNNSHNLTQFNMSVLITDEFMKAVEKGGSFDLVFDGRVYETVNANHLWDSILRSTWEWAEPGVIFIDRVNEMNNLWWIEDISATNPCLHPDTLIETVEGRVRIADIKEPTIVYTSLPDGSLGMARATASWVSKKNTFVWKIKTRNGKEIKLTPDHKVLTHEHGWVEAKDLKLGDRIVQLCRARRGAVYSGVKLTTEDNRAYKMEHRMIAESVYGDLGDNVVHHINGDTYDNHIDNFEVMAPEEHNKLTASTSHPQCHKVHCCVTGQFVSTGKSPKRTIPMPEHLKSNMKNNYSNAVVEIIEDFEVVDVYDMNVEGTHNMIGNFMVVHNCGEQPLPEYGACLLGSINWVKYIKEGEFDYDQLAFDIPHIVRAMDNVIDRTIYPLYKQEVEAKGKRRMGLGHTGVANTLAILGYEYGSKEACEFVEEVMEFFATHVYASSVSLAIEKGPFPLFDAERYCESKFIKRLPPFLQKDIKSYGIRNSHLLSIAPTGTISLTADNVSSGIEPVFSHYYDRTIQTENGPIIERVEDYAYREWGIQCKTANEVTVDEHINMLISATKWVDSSVSKTCNVGDNVTWEEFKDIYMKAYKGGAKGCTTFRSSGKRFGILNASASEDVIEERQKEDETTIEGGACYVDLETGLRSCE